MKDLYLGHELKKIRLMHGYTQHYVAQKIQVSRKWYGMIENGETVLKEKHLVKIAELYNITLEELKKFNKGSLFSLNKISNNNTSNNFIWW